MSQYNPQEIEPKWHKHWDETNLYKQVIDESKEKHYAMTMLPYPSGDLHIGHWYAMSPSDARARPEWNFKKIVNLCKQGKVKFIIRPS